MVVYVVADASKSESFNALPTLSLYPLSSSKIPSELFLQENRVRSKRVVTPVGRMYGSQVLDYHCRDE